MCQRRSFYEASNSLIGKLFLRDFQSWMYSRHKRIRTEAEGLGCCLPFFLAAFADLPSIVLLHSCSSATVGLSIDLPLVALKHFSPCLLLRLFLAHSSNFDRTKKKRMPLASGPPLAQTQFKSSSQILVCAESASNNSSLETFFFFFANLITALVRSDAGKYSIPSQS